MIKFNYEIESIKEASNILSLAFDYACSCLSIGITELELATEISVFFKRHDVVEAFPVIIAFGENSFNLHHSPTDKQLFISNLVLIDFGVQYNGYAADMSRTVIFKETVPVVEEAYKIVEEAYHKCLQICKPNISIKEICYEVGKILDLGFNFGINKHLIGHGIGLSVHEYPVFFKDNLEILKENMVIAIEPALYNQSFGGIRIEDTLLITENGNIPLTKGNTHFTVIV